MTDSYYVFYMNINMDGVFFNEYPILKYVCSFLNLFYK